MNYITSCPECGTQFLLNKEHLKAHRGKVQCGHCEHVFNAKNRLTEVSDDIHSTEEYQASLEQENQDATNQVVEGNVAYEEASRIEEIELTDGPTYIGEFSPTVTEPIVIEDLTTDPKFSRKKIKLNLWYSLASVFLIFFAALQSAYFMRTKLAVDHPQLKPILTQGCALLHCEISLPKELDFLAIDDSDMQEDENYEGVINFSSSLINNANHIQTYPNIELTLTNAGDQPVLRRLIKPNEYLAPEVKIDNGMRAHEEIRVKLAINASDENVAGYRVLLVY
jgi:predicted Zn finger-like uncharacterized protein